MNIQAQKIDSFNLTTYKMVSIRFYIADIFRKAYFFKNIFLLINISIDIILKILFLILINANILFAE